MADQATQSLEVNASPTHCFEVAIDFERYPEWAKDVKSVNILEYDEAGRPLEVEFRASAIGYSTHYTLRYDYSAAPGTLSWKLTKGDIMRACDGSYTFEGVDGDPSLAVVTYRLSVELIVPLPGFVKRRAEVRILSSLKELKARAERG